MSLNFIVKSILRTSSAFLELQTKKIKIILTWGDKCKLAYQLVCAVSYLHNEEIVNRNLHSDNILIHRHTIKLADFGLSKGIKKVSGQRESDLFVNIPYVDPKKEIIVPNTPVDYSNIYTECWNYDPDNRPDMNQKI
ncbi:unnamed protein product [Rhizophagus irregularis]|nr:unnamed protein product [Rhizophagus irregularis]